MYALLLLQVMDHRKQVARLRIPFRPEHSHETLARLVENLREFLKPNRRIDIVTQHCLAGIDITGEQAFDPFLQQGLAKRRIRDGRRLPLLHAKFLALLPNT